nr:DNA mismatch repair protein MutS [Clostridia bacterium]
MGHSMTGDLMARVTPMMRQYLETKQKAGDCLLFFRLGDFYELFFEDAQVASRELELVLTGKDCGLEERAPMCGIPYHAATSYIGRLVSRGYKVAVCEQMEDPATAKGIVKRDIIKVYTPGTVTDEAMLDQKSNNYIAAVFGLSSFYGLACCDITTGEFKVTSFTVGATLTHLRDELARLMPKELVVNDDCPEAKDIIAAAETYSGAFANKIGPEFFDETDANANLERMIEAGKKLKGNYKKAEGRSIGDSSGSSVSETGSLAGTDAWAVRAAGCLVKVLEDTQKISLEGIIRPVFYKTSEFMTVDAQSRRNLEISEAMRDRKKYGSLLWVLDKTETAMGGRKLKSWLEMPLIDKAEIDLRQDAVAELFDKFMLRSEIMEHLKGVYDVERLAGRVTMGSCNAREMLSLKQSLMKLPALKELLKTAESGLLKKLYGRINTLEELADLLERAIADDPPVTITDGDIIKTGFDETIDHYRAANIDGKRWLSDLEAREREKTGIKKLKVGYNTVFGYYIEISNSFKDLVPPDYVRKQTLTNAERYITDELKKLETELLDAERNLKALEEKRFREIREYAAGFSAELHENADAVAILDVLCSFATVAERENYSRPEITEETIVELKNARHPVVEKMPGCDVFVPNDAKLDCEENMLLVITGPNMAGKSTYMRMVALIVLMA